MNLFLQGIALLSTGSLGHIIIIFMLPALTGTFLAMLFPDIGGLDQPLELESYWLQHYLIQAMPIYLLIRHQALALRNTTIWTSAIGGLWILWFLHFSLYEVSFSPYLYLNIMFIFSLSSCVGGRCNIISEC
jgi:hypothetical protein